MNFKNILFSLTLFALMSFGLPKNIQKKVDKEIEMAFNVEEFVLNEKIVPENLLQTLPSVFLKDNLFEIKQSDVLLGYAYISKAASKTDEFDYLVLFDKELIILGTKVLTYRENYGGEIGSKRWLKQFNGKTQNDTLLIGDNIVAISGATISVRSMTNAVNNLLQSIKILHQNNIL